MSSKRNIRRKRCGNKIGHDTREGATIMRTKLRKSGSMTDGMQTYKCNMCGKWHLGHTRVEVHPGRRP